MRWASPPWLLNPSVAGGSPLWPNCIDYSAKGVALFRSFCGKGSFAARCFHGSLNGISVHRARIFNHHFPIRCAALRREVDLVTLGGAFERQLTPLPLDGAFNLGALLLDRE